MPKNSGAPNRNLLNHGNGKGDKTRVTDKKAYDENFDAIDWSSERTGRTRKSLKTLRELEQEEREWQEDYNWRMGL